MTLASSMPRERLDRCVFYRVAFDRRAHCFAHEPECVTVGDLLPDVCGENCGAVDGAHALHRRIQDSVEIRMATGAELLYGIAAGGNCSCRDAGDDLLFNGFVHGYEQRLLVTEVMLQGAAGHSRRGDDLLAARLGVALGGEEHAAPRR